MLTLLAVLLDASASATTHQYYQTSTTLEGRLLSLHNVKDDAIDWPKTTAIKNGIRANEQQVPCGKFGNKLKNELFAGKHG